MTLREMMQRMDADELFSWMQFYSEEPFGAERDNLHAGLICMMLSRTPKGKKGPTLKDFMIRPAEEAKQDRLKRGLAWLTQIAKPADNLLKPWKRKRGRQ